jgi:small-conductance mechanosensitive channel
MPEILERIRDGVFNEMVQGFSSAIPRLITAILVLVVGRMIAGLLRNIIRKALSTIGIDRLAEKLNDIDMVQRSGMRIELSAMIGQAVYYVIMLGFIIMATDALGIQAITDMVRSIVAYLPSLFSALVMLLLGLFLADGMRGILQTTLQSMGVPSAKTIAMGAFYFLFVTVAISALSQAQISTGFMAQNLTVLIGAIALAFAIGYGLASKDLVSNYLASYYNKDKVRVGDDIEFDGVRGKVVLIDASSMILQTPERAIIIPLSKLTTEKVQVIYPDPDEENKRIEDGDA